MDKINPQVMFGRVYHKRLFPKVNTFSYGIYYFLLPINKILKAFENRYFKINRFGLQSFYTKDHGEHKKGSDLQHWAKNILTEFGGDRIDGDIRMLTMPRVMGYVFNPISFWFCHDKDGVLRSVICEVNNTFGEAHIYICIKDDQSQIKSDDVLKAQKVFHVSPFLKREGSYEFRFDITADTANIKIDYFDKDGRKQLITGLNGHFQGLNKTSCRRAFWCYPLVTLKAITLIHWQALKLLYKRIKYIPKPEQKKPKKTKTTELH